VLPLANRWAGENHKTQLIKRGIVNFQHISFREGPCDRSK
jgi:hypothetical protein